MSTFDGKPSESSSSLKSYPSKPVEEKKTKAAKQLFEGINDKTVDDYDDYEVDEPQVEEPKQP